MPTPTRGAMTAAALILVAFAFACSSDSPDPEVAAISTARGDAVNLEIAPDSMPTLLQRLEQYPTFNDTESGFGAILGTPDLGKGSNRVAFVLTDNAVGIIRTPFARVATYFVPDGGTPEGPVESATARFFSFPLGVRGLYVATLNLDRAGTWELDATVPDASGKRVGMRFPITVKPSSDSVAIGAPIPPTSNRTLADVELPAMLSTASEPDESLYDRRVDDLIAAGTPFVLTFASPAFCTNALCGPQVEVLSGLESRFVGEVEFVHIDLYENPDEIKGDLSRARRTPILDDWGVHTDEWTFVVGSDGRVAAKFEAFVPEEELAAAVEQYLAAPG